MRELLIPPHWGIFYEKVFDGYIAASAFGGGL